MEILGFGAVIVIGSSWMLKFIMARFVAQSAEIKLLREEVYNLATNHIAHSTRALEELTVAIRAMK